MMHKELYFEDVELGMDIPPLAKIASTRVMVEWAGAVFNFDPIHYEDDYAKAKGFSGPLVHGSLKSAWLGQLITDWIGMRGKIKKLSCQYRMMDYPRKMRTMEEPNAGETWWCRGKVTRKYVEKGEPFVECDIWVENGKGEKTTPGRALVILPSREKK